MPNMRNVKVVFTSRILFDDGDEVRATTENIPVRFLLISGKPIEEPVAWYGPIVMNTQKELNTAFEEYENGTFLKHEEAGYTASH